MFFKHITILFVKILPLLLTLFITSCTVITEKPINNMVLDSLEDGKITTIEWTKIGKALGVFGKKK